MKIFAIFCIFVAGAESTSYSISSSGYSSQETSLPQIETRSTAFKYEAPPVNDYSPISVKTDSYRQSHILERPIEIRVLKQEIPITRFSHLINPKSNEYSFSYESKNGIQSNESGSLKNILVARTINGGNNYGYGNTRVEEVVGAAHVKSGETSWCSPEGLRFTLTYTADETGYHPTLTKGLCQQPAALVRDTQAYGQTRLIPRNLY